MKNELKKCACGRPSNHSVGMIDKCCECYVNEGNPPADWHPKCIETYENQKK